MTKETLEIMTVKDLRNEAKNLKIVGRWDKTKEQLITAILEAYAKNSEEAKEEKEIGNEEETKPINTVDTEKEKLAYVERISIGALVAFKIGDKVKSAKVINKSTAKRILKVENKAGKEFILSYEDIIWVKTKRWPRNIYNLLKGAKRC